MTTPLTTMSFTVKPGEAGTAQVQALLVDENNAPAPEVYTATIAETADWIHVTPLNGTAPFTVAVTVNAGSRPDGSYRTQLTGTTNPAATSIELPEVTMTIKTPPPAPPVDTTPPVVMINPLRWVGKKVTIAANAWGQDAQYMEILVDNELRTTAPGASITMLWNTASLKVKVHTIEVRAYDVAGNRGSSKVAITLP